MSDTLTEPNSDTTITLLTDECLICFEELSKGETIILDCCNKKIHTKCIVQWITTPNRDIKCPNCQKNLSNTIVAQAQGGVESKYPKCFFTYAFWSCCWLIFILSICVIIFAIPRPRDE